MQSASTRNAHNEASVCAFAGRASRALHILTAADKRRKLAARAAPAHSLHRIETNGSAAFLEPAANCPVRDW
jgi:hypothetical protein